MGAYTALLEPIWITGAYLNYWCLYGHLYELLAPIWRVGAYMNYWCLHELLVPIWTIGACYWCLYELLVPIWLCWCLYGLLVPTWIIWLCLYGLLWKYGFCGKYLCTLNLVHVWIIALILTSSHMDYWPLSAYIIYYSAIVLLDIYVWQTSTTWA